VSDALPIDSQVDLIKRIVPDVQSIGVVYNPGEVNSVKMVQAFKEALAAQNLQCVEATASKTSDINAAVNSLIGKVQAIYIPNDNTAVAAMRNIALLAERHKIPLFAGDVGSVAAGALATQGYNRVELGKKAGEQVVSILKGTNAAILPILANHSLEIFVNEEMASHIGVQLPADILKTATKVGASA
jgi:putative ABC transport system substrate-binding protein